MSSVPSVDITKQDFQTGSVGPSSLGVLAIIAASQTGTPNAASTYARDDLALTDYGHGPLVEYASYCLQVGQNPVVLVKPTTAVAGAYGSITKTIAGTCVPTADASLPLDEWDVVVKVMVGGTVGVAGIQYQYSLDGGDEFTGTIALGTSTTLSIPGTGVAFDLPGSSTLVAGDSWSCFTTRPQPNNTDLPASLEALRVTRLPWEGMLVDCVYGTGTVGLIDTWLEGLEAVGQFHYALLNTRHKTQPVPTAETESAYAAAMTTLTANDASIRVCVGVDAADYTSTLTGWSQPRPTALFVAARAMKVSIGEDPAFVARGNLPNASIADGKGNPRWHDEDLYPSLDSQRLTTLRSFSPGGPNGVYVCNANVLSPVGSDYVWLQHVRCMNAACTIAWQILSGQLSRGVGKNPPDKVTGAVTITEQDAQNIDSLVNSAFTQPMKNQVSAVQFKLSRTDDFSSNTNSKATGTVKIVSLAYLKKYAITSEFAKTIAVAA